MTRTRRLYLIAAIIILFLVAAIVPPLLLPRVAGGITVSDTTAQELVREANTHFDHPLQRIAVIRYQVTGKRQWQGDDVYTITGRTIFGIPLNKAEAYMNGRGMVSIPSLENDVILEEQGE